MHVKTYLIRGAALLALGAVAALGVDRAGAQESSPQESTPRERVEELLPGLLSPHSDEHDIARRRLLELGPEGRQEMQRLSRSDDPKLRALALEMLARQDWAVPAEETRSEGETSRLPRDVEELLERHLDGRPLPGVTLPGVARSGFFSSGSMTTGDGKRFAWETTEDGGVKVTVQDGPDAERQVYEAESMEALQEAHPEIAEKIGGFGLGSGLRFDFPEMELDFRLPRIEIPHLEVTPPSEGPRWERFRELQERMRDQLLRLEREILEPRSSWDLPRRTTGPRLGVEVRPADDVLRSHLGFRGGLVVHEVVPDSLASRLGLRRHDVLLELDGTRVDDGGDIAPILERSDDAASHRALVIRGGERTELNTTR